MKTFKIFLRLKWEEIRGVCVWKEWVIILVVSIIGAFIIIKYELKIIVYILWIYGSLFWLFFIINNIKKAKRIARAERRAITP